MPAGQAAPRPPPGSPAATRANRAHSSPTRSACRCATKSADARRPEETPMSSEVKVPTLGESVSEATIGQWLKQPGDPVKLDEPIASLETDKVAIEVPAPANGVMGALRAKEGDTVTVGAT